MGIKRKLVSETRSALLEVTPEIKEVQTSYVCLMPTSRRQRRGWERRSLLGTGMKKLPTCKFARRFEQRHKGIRVSSKRSICDGLGWMRRLPY